MQVSTFSAQSGGATFVPNGRSLIELMPQTDKRLRYCTNTGSKLSKFSISEQLKHLKSFDDENTNFRSLPSVPFILPEVQSSFF